jgi:hypothetical protein
MTHLDRLQGAWWRSLIEWPDGTRDVTTKVLWLQGPTFYIDLRQPFPMSDFGKIRALRDLDAAQVEALAAQEGFAGVLLEHPTCFEWTRQIDFQPKPIYSDRGTLEDRGEVMVERGCDVDYIEHWHRDAAVSGTGYAVKLRDRASGCPAMIVGVGDRFMFARARAASLDESRPLLDYVRDAPTLTAAQDLVDCELSLGVVEDGWRIERSSLPFRVGADLELRMDAGLLTTSDITPDGAPVRRIWDIQNGEGDFAAAFGAGAQPALQSDGRA